jgi:exosortase J
MTDALKSIGMIVPVVSFVLVLREWRRLGWEMEGSWWGLAILLVTIVLVRLRDQALMLFVFSPQWTVSVPPPSFIVFAYGAGVVLLFGGKRLFCAALFPLLLLWFVNPVPHIFNVAVDLPLQRVSAHVARAFAMALGQKLTPDQMRLMFTPDFGMFIAPGCNGIRGAVTMGFIALIAGYLYRFRWYALAAVVAGAVLLGYVFNFVRLCTLVLYYLVALRITWLQPWAEMGDYILGGCLFLFATLLLFSAVQRLGESKSAVSKSVVSRSAVKDTPRDLDSDPALPSFVHRRLVVFALLALFGCYGVVRAFALGRSSDRYGTELSPSALGDFPRQIGSYTLVREWNENLNTGTLIYHWAEYAPAGGGTHISIGVSPVLGAHDTLLCHIARGEDPLWRDQMTVQMANGAKVDFNTSYYNEATQLLEASTVCTGTACGEYSSDRKNFGLVYSKPDPKRLLAQDPQRPIPILIKAETPDTSIASDPARHELMDAMKSFLSAANFDTLTEPYRRQ